MQICSSPLLQFAAAKNLLQGISIQIKELTIKEWIR